MFTWTFFPKWKWYIFYTKLWWVSLNNLKPGFKEIFSKISLVGMLTCCTYFFLSPSLKIALSMDIKECEPPSTWIQAHVPSCHRDMACIFTVVQDLHLSIIYINKCGVQYVFIVLSLCSNSSTIFTALLWSMFRWASSLSWWIVAEIEVVWGQAVLKKGERVKWSSPYMFQVIFSLETYN